MSSTRLPGKVLRDLDGIPMIGYQLKRVLKSTLVNKVVVATSTDESDNPLVAYLDTISQEVVRGPLNDVLKRFLMVLDIYNPSYFVRITGDCPLVMPDLLDSMISEFESSSLDYLSNALNPSFPDGLDVEIVKTSALRRLDLLQLSEPEREHVTLGFYSRPTDFILKNFNYSLDLSRERWTVDYPEDLEFIRRVVKYENALNQIMSLENVLKFLEDYPDLRNKVSSDLRNEAIKEWRTQVE
jgi:spore coat polysaccharide biosynthesis protein SpsF (cytidylyltransferase family)